MTVYLLCFDRPIAEQTSDGRETRHYVGYTSRLRARLDEHAGGRGARLVQVARERGIPWELVRTWPEADRAVERWLKRSHNRARFCPRCRPGTRAGLRIDALVPMPLPASWSGAADVRRAVFERPRIRRPGIRFRWEPCALPRVNEAGAG